MAALAARQSALLLLAVSGGLLMGALAFQFIGGLVPCQMCHWQRWAHVGVIALALVTLARPSLLPLTLVGMTVAAGLALYHVGVEQRWWDGPGCAMAVRPGDDLLGSLISAPVVRCDQIPWSLLGLSMAGWNMLVSVVAVLAAALRWRRAWT